MNIAEVEILLDKGESGPIWITDINEENGESGITRKLEPGGWLTMFIYDGRYLRVSRIEPE